MRFQIFPAVLAATFLLLWPAPSRAVVHAGDSAPTFIKNRLDTGGGVPHAGDTLSLGPFLGKVLILNLFGYNCPFCLGDGASVEQDLNQHYQQTAPGKVLVLGADLYNGTASNVDSYRSSTGATYPLLLQGASPTGGNFSTIFGPFDNFVILNSSGVVRYHAADKWPHGNRFHLNELLATVDSLVANIASAEGGGTPGPSLRVFPTPFRGSAQVEFQVPAGSGDARVEIYSMEGRRVANLTLGSAGGVVRTSWDGRVADGSRAPSGVYVVLARAEGLSLRRRVVFLR